MKKIVIANSKKWFKSNLKDFRFVNTSIVEINSNKELNINYLSKINPDYIFFPHWSWKVDAQIFEKYKCVVFHTAPLPFGRGGTPIQNLILLGYDHCPVNALRMTQEIDAGPIYLSEEVSLSGNIDEVFARIEIIIKKMMLKILDNEIEPIDQVGNPFVFKRLNYSDNDLSNSENLKEIYNKIRMVDGKDYKKAYISFGNFKMEFYNSNFNGDEIYSNVRIIKNK